MGYLLPRIGKCSISNYTIFTHAFGQAGANVGYEALLCIGAYILAIYFAGMVYMLEFPKASSEGQF